MELNVFMAFELIVIAIIVVYQLKILITQLGRIHKFKTFIPNRRYFKTEKCTINKEFLKNGDVSAVLEVVCDVSQAEVEFMDSKQRKGEVLDITLINPKTRSGTYFDQIVDSLNIYLLKNNGRIADFSIVKDLVERNVAVEEGDIKDSISTPLYLGLMATILGIIIGLASMIYNVYGSEGINEQLDLKDFLISVCIAMVASLLGLTFTTVLGTWRLKNAKRIVEYRKNEFYNFIQTDLLPVVSQDFGSSISSLTRTMSEFSTDFTRNVNTLSSLFTRNYEILKVQDAILDKLQKLDAQNFAKVNASLLSKLQYAVGEFDKFNTFIESLNSRMTETRELSLSLNNLMNRVNNFEQIAFKIDSRIDESNRILSLIDFQFSEVENMKQRYSMMVGRVDDHLDETLQVFVQHVVSKREGLVRLINEQQELLEKAYTENKTKFDKLDLLEKLDKLDVLYDIKEIALLGQGQLEQGAAQLNNLEKAHDASITSINDMLEVIETVKKNTDLALSKNDQFGTKLTKVEEKVGNLEKNVKIVKKGFFRKIFTKN